MSNNDPAQRTPPPKLTPIFRVLILFGWVILIAALTGETRPYGRVSLPMMGMLIVFGVFNLIYVFRAPESDTPSRLSRIIRLWLDAKENELRKRAGTERSE